MNKRTPKYTLSKLQIDVTQNCGTEKPFDNEYWDNKKDGIYVDIISGEPLFCSLHKYDSGTGWPSFYDVIRKDSISEHKDFSLGYERTEVKSIKSNSHLGHKFEDGPNNNPRFCINSASLMFIPLDELEENGYADLMYLFKKNIK